jgi:hypothetical protein
MNLYYAVATLTDTDDSEILLEWYYYEHDFGGVELVDDKLENDLLMQMSGKEWSTYLKRYYSNVEIVRL